MGAVVMRRDHGGSGRKVMPDISIDLGNNITVTELASHSSLYRILTLRLT